MWKSPIDTIITDVQTRFEDDVLKAVQKVNIFIDREELIKALEYDRGQYEKGYADGLADAEKTGCWVWTDGVRCSRCNHKLQTTGLPSYCPNCGASMRVDNNE